MIENIASQLSPQQMSCFNTKKYKNICHAHKYTFNSNRLKHLLNKKDLKSSNLKIIVQPFMENATVVCSPHLKKEKSDTDKQHV